MDTNNYISALSRYLIIVMLFLSCKARKTVNEKIDTSSPWYAAWNEDSVNSYKFVRLKNKRFVYEVVKNDSTTKTRRTLYYGSYSETFDTIHLSFNNAPPNWANYLVREASGRYVIQRFTDGRKSIFMRIFSSSFR